MQNNDRSSATFQFTFRHASPQDSNPRRGRTPPIVLGAVAAISLLSGCASARVQGDSDPWKYNPNTGYPAVGAPSWGTHL